MLSGQNLSTGFFHNKPKSSFKIWAVIGLFVVAIFGCIGLNYYKNSPSDMAFDSEVRTLSNDHIVNSYVSISRNDNRTHIIADFEYKGTDLFYKNQSSPIVKRIRLLAFFKSPSQFNVRVISLDEERWEVPKGSPFPFLDPTNAIDLSDGRCDIIVSPDIFGIKITRKDTQEVVFDTNNASFIYSDLYLEISTAIPNSNIFSTLR